MSEGAVLALGDDWNIYHTSTTRSSFLSPLMASVNFWRFKATLVLIDVVGLLSRGVAWVRGVEGGLERMIDNEMDEVRSRYGLGEKV
jgi:hypothetical protein